MATLPETIFDFDLTKTFGDIKVPGLDVEGLLTSHRKNVEALTQASKLAVEGVQAVFQRHTDILRQTIEDSVAAAKDLADAGTPHDKVIRHTEITKSALERARANARELTEIITKSQSEAFDLLNTRFSEALDELKETVAKSKPQV